jgi:hypothetical protein
LSPEEELAFKTRTGAKEHAMKIADAVLSKKYF